MPAGEETTLDYGKKPRRTLRVVVVVLMGAVVFVYFGGYAYLKIDGYFEIRTLPWRVHQRNVLDVLYEPLEPI